MRIEKFNIRLAAVLENFRYQTSQGYTDTHIGGPLTLIGTVLLGYEMCEKIIAVTVLVIMQESSSCEFKSNFLS